MNKNKKYKPKQADGWDKAFGAKTRVSQILSSALEPTDKHSARQAGGESFS